MKAIEFRESTKVSKGVNGNIDLHYWSDSRQCISCWRPTFKERLSILLTGKVWLGVMSGKTQPPVFVSGISVFKSYSRWQKIKFAFLDLRHEIANFINPYKEELND